MAAEAPHQQERKKKPPGQVVQPQPVPSVKSFLDNVAGFIHEMTPLQVALDTKEVVRWVRFESLEDAPGTLLLILGYNTGVQVWAVGKTGEAVEVLSWKQGSVRLLHILPEPSQKREDSYVSQRPLMVLCDSSTANGPPYSTLTFLSLKTGDQVKTIQCKAGVTEILADHRAVVVTCLSYILVLDASSLEQLFQIDSCYPALNPVALGSRWLVYPDRKLIMPLHSDGGVSSDAQSYTASVINAAKTLTKSLKGVSTSDPQWEVGVLTVVDLANAERGEWCLHAESRGIVAHFRAHSHHPVVAMNFDNSGNLLLTADKPGNVFNVFRIHAHPLGSFMAAVQHLYCLHRGDTTARVQQMTFSSDARWVAVSTLRGTTHLFPITPYGGPVTTRTHLSRGVVNRLSSFHRSAGLDEGFKNGFVCIGGTRGDPTAPRFPHPTVVMPLAQLRHGGFAVPPSTEETNCVRIAAKFTSGRPQLVQPFTSKKASETLYVLTCHGLLFRYCLEPQASSSSVGGSGERVLEESPLEVNVKAEVQWKLLPPLSSLELHPPLYAGNPLLHMGNPQGFLGTSARLTSTQTTPGSHPPAWLSMVEIATYQEPHRRLWMGPQFTFHPLDQATPTTGSRGLMMQRPIHGEEGDGERRKLVEIYGAQRKGTPKEASENKIEENLAEAMEDTSLPVMSDTDNPRMEEEPPSQARLKGKKGKRSGLK